jgi:hypothetical protein
MGRKSETHTQSTSRVRSFLLQNEKRCSSQATKGKCIRKHKKHQILLFGGGKKHASRRREFGVICLIEAANRRSSCKQTMRVRGEESVHLNQGSDVVASESR